VSHGNNSLLATKTALKLADYVVTESGFGTDLGLQKFFDFVCKAGDIKPAVCVLVVTIKAIQEHSAGSSWQLGFENILKHVENIRLHGVEAVVAINRFPQDSDEEVKKLEEMLSSKNVPNAVSLAVRDGGKGAIDLAEKILKIALQKKTLFKPLFQGKSTPEEKLTMITQKIYGGDGIALSPRAKRDLALIRKLGIDHLSVNVAKTPFSLSDDSSKKGAPKGWRLKIRKIRIFAGAGYLVAITGKLLLMPGMPKDPLYERMRLSDDGKVTLE
jgi:formate--tetrahydrofolate ligase